MKQDINRAIVEYLKVYNPTRIGLFGSYARGDDSAQSDIDILIQFKTTPSLFDLGGIKYELTEILQRNVDVVSESALNEQIKAYVYKDLKVIFE